MRKLKRHIQTMRRNKRINYFFKREETNSRPPLKLSKNFDLVGWKFLGI